MFEVTFDKENCVFHFTSNTQINGWLSILDAKIECSYYTTQMDIYPGVWYWTIPFPKNHFHDIVKNDKQFRGFIFNFYSQEKRIVFSKEFVLNDVETISFNAPHLESTGYSYLDFFYTDLCADISFQNGVIVDAGANIGLFTLLALQKGARKIYAIEPDPCPFFYLRSNFRNNSNVILLNNALVGNSEMDKFQLHLNGSVASSYFVENLTSNPDIMSIDVQTLRIQNILEQEGKIDLLKLDIEGAEYDVLKSLDQSDFSRISQMFIEWHNYSDEIIPLLEKNNYIYNLKHLGQDRKQGFIYAHK
jgi:FkbM family methyltransferase